MVLLKSYIPLGRAWKTEFNDTNMTDHKKFSARVILCFLQGGGGPPMNDYIFTCERSNVTSTFVAFFGQNRCFMSVRRYFQPNRLKKINFNFFDRCETLPLRLLSNVSIKRLKKVCQTFIRNMVVSVQEARYCNYCN